MHMMAHYRLEEYEDEINGANAVRQLSWMPGFCPVEGCNYFLFPSNLMTHILRKHSHDRDSPICEIYEHSPFLLTFNPKGLQYGKNRCIASFMYGGVRERHETQPCLGGMCVPNLGLPNIYQQYHNYLPIMLLVCRTSWFAHMGNKDVEQQLLSKNSENAGIYVFWLVSPVTTRKLYYTLTIFDRQYISSRSAVRVVRNYTSFQDPSDFLPIDENYLLLRDVEVADLMSVSKSFASSHNADTIPIEVIVYEAPLPVGDRRDELQEGPGGALR